MPISKKGLASNLCLKCTTCLFEKTFYTSSTEDNGKGFDVNKRMVYAMRTCGQGHAGIETFTTLMNIPKPMTVKNYNKIVMKFVKSVKDVAEETMADAVDELPIDDDSATKDVSISMDGSWQRRGYASLNGCVTAILMETGKIINVEAMSRYCKACTQKESIRLSNPEQYESWNCLLYTSPSPRDS